MRQLRRSCLGSWRATLQVRSRAMQRSGRAQAMHRRVDGLDAALADHIERCLSKAPTFRAGGAVHCIKTR